MAFSATVLKVVIGSPSDLVEERDAAEASIYEWNANNAEAERVTLLPVRWETQTHPETAVRPQDAINRQIIDGSDILLALFWTRLGTDTGVAPSGTVEEVDRFAASNRPVMIYFSQRPVVPSNIDLQQLSRLRDFQSSTYSTALSATFSSPAELGHLLFKNMTSLVRQLQATRSEVSDHQLADQSEAAETPKPDDFYRARPDWGLWEFQRAYLVATHTGREDLAGSLNADFISSPLASTAQAQAEWEAWMEYSRLHAGTGGDVGRISRLSEDYPSSAEIKLTLGSALALYDKGAAAHTFREAAAVATAPSDLYQAVRRAVSLEAEAELAPETDSLLALLRQAPLPEGAKQAPALEAMRLVAKARGLDAISLALAERLSSIAPQDTHLRFSLAHELAEGGRAALAKLHYEAIPPAQRSGAAWNNLGAALNTLDMPGAAVAAYGKASKMKETIADANIASKLREAGFFDEAQERLEAALLVPDYHTNVVASLEALREAREEETQRDKASVKAARAERRFRDAAGGAAVAQVPQDVAGQWDVGECTVDLRSDGSGSLSGTGSFDTEDNTLGAWMRPSGRRSKTVEVRVELRRFGNAFEGRVSRIPQDHTPSFLGDMFLSQAVLAYVEPDGEAIYVWEIGSEFPAAVWHRNPKPLRDAFPDEPKTGLLS